MSSVLLTYRFSATSILKSTTSELQTHNRRIGKHSAAMKRGLRYGSGQEINSTHSCAKSATRSNEPLDSPRSRRFCGPCRGTCVRAVARPAFRHPPIEISSYLWTWISTRPTTFERCTGTTLPYDARLLQTKGHYEGLKPQSTYKGRYPILLSVWKILWIIDAAPP